MLAGWGAAPGIDLATVVVGDAASPVLDGDHYFAVVFADATPALVAWLRERRPCARPAGPVAHVARAGDDASPALLRDGVEPGRHPGALPAPPSRGSTRRRRRSSSSSGRPSWRPPGSTRLV